MTRAALAACILLAASGASAQTPANRPLRRPEVSVAVGLLGGSGLGTRDAELRADGRPFPLFTTDSRFGASPAIEVRAGLALSRRYAVEGTFAFGRPELHASVSADAEGAPPVVVSERIDEYRVEGGLVVSLDELRLGPLVPVAAFGAGYVRQLHEGLTLVEHGRSFHAGLGLRHWLFTRDRGALRATGLRVDARLYVVDGGITVDDGPRSQGAISGGLFVVF